MSILSGIVGMIISILLFIRFNKVKNRATLTLALCTLVYAIGNFLWAIEDYFALRSFQISTAAYISNYLPAYLGFLFVIFALKIREKITVPISSVIMAIGILGFILFPIECGSINGTYTCFPAHYTRLLLIPTILMAFAPVVLLFLYGNRMRALKQKKERDKGFVLASGFLLVALGEHILVPYLRVPLFYDQILLLTGFLIVYLGFNLDARNI